MGKRYTLSEVIKVGIQSEKKLQMIYMNFSNLFMNLAEIRDFWRELSNDEKMHAKCLEQLKFNREDLFKMVDGVIQEKVASLENISVDKLLLKVKNLDDAFEIMHKLEHSEIDFMFEFLMGKSIDSQDRMEIINCKIRKHYAKFAYTDTFFKDREWRRQQIISD